MSIQTGQTEAAPANSIAPYLKLLRPHQWVKNAFVFLPLFFSLNLKNTGMLWHEVLIFLVFCLCASAMYILNDLRDIDEDRAHPTKKNRPIASGV